MYMYLLFTMFKYFANHTAGGNLRSSKRMQYFKTFTIEYSKIYLCYEMDVYRLDSNYNLSS